MILSSAEVRGSSVSYWAIEPAESGIGLFLEKDDLLPRIIKDGLNVETVRSALLSDTDGDLYFQVLLDEKKMDCSTLPELPDFTVWAWVPVFSQRAMEVGLACGSKGDDFLRCHLRGFPSTFFYLHLPTVIHDALDFSASEFEINIPINPPLLLRLQAARFLVPPDSLPSIFRLLSKNNNQVLDDLLVDDRFKSKWDAGGLKGAAFRTVK